MMPVVRTPMEGGGGGGPHGPTGGSISLGHLIDFIVQRTYHELTVLSELLPRKNDMERKIEIVQFASRTRQLCIRLLALVKWAGSVSKVDKSAGIMAFLDKQSMLFIDTADKLSQMARQELVAARLPTFHIPAAVEVLTTGSYSRLPLCIRERIVPAKAITPVEKATTLQRLDQIIEHRLVTADLPPQMLQLKIGGGRVRITVEHEFQVSLTLMGDGPTVPWTLLEIEILVEDKETGEGKSLVHPLQVHYLHQLVSSYLADSARPLHDIYTILHSFCQSLQLEVLHSQVVQLCRDRLGDNVRVHDYQPGRLLSVAYWREVTGREARSEPAYRVSLQADPADAGRPLLVTHWPPLQDSRSAEQAERAVRSDRLSLERLLVHTIHLRSRAVLADMREQLARLVQLPAEQLTLAGSPAVLSVPLLQPCLKGEHLLVAVDVHRGTLSAHVPLYETPVCEEVTAALNGDCSQLRALLTRLRFWVTLRRAEKTLQHLPASAHEALPLSYREGHPLGRLPAHQIYVRLHRFPRRVLVVVCQERPGSPNSMTYSFYMVTVKPCSIEDGSEDANERHLPKKYLKVLTFVELDTFLCLHGPGTVLEAGVAETPRQRAPSAPGSPSRAAGSPAFFITELAQVVALCDEQIPCAALCSELSRQRVPHGGAAVDPSGQSRYIRLIDLPTVADVEPVAMEQLRRALLSATITQQEDKQGSRWAVEYVFHGAPARSQQRREQASRRLVHFWYPQPAVEAVSEVVDRLLADWRQMAELYALLLAYQQFVADDRQRGLSQLTEISSFTYRTLTLAYGPSRGSTVKVEYSSDEKRFRLSFGINARSSSATNPHAMLRGQLEDLLNAERSLAQLMVALDSTYSPLVSLDKLSATPRLGVRSDRPLEPVPNFILLPQTAWHVRLVYRKTYCLSIHLHSDELVSVRDGAFCVSDRSRPLDELTPLRNLSAFLAKYAADPSFSGVGGEDDTPPSPTSLELDPPSAVPAPAARPSGSPAAHARFAHPMTPGSLSQPHTPASPLQPSPAPAAPVVSSSPAPSSTPLHAPSPGFLPAPSPSHVGHSPAAAGAMSPFTAQPLMSPAVAGSPAVSKAPATRLRPAAAPVMLSHESFDQLCTRAPVPPAALRAAPDVMQVSPLERHLGCVYLRAHLRKTLESPSTPSIVRLQPTEQGVIMFKTTCLQCRVRLEPEHVQTLHLSVQPNPDSMEQWQPEEMQVLERYFETKVAVPPYRHNTLKTFITMLNRQAKVLRDFIRILQLEEITSDPNNPKASAMNWSVEWCTTSHPAALPALIPVGLVSLIIVGNKVLFFLQLTRRLAAPTGSEPARIVLPVVYDMADNMTQCADKKDYQPNQVAQQVNQLMRRSSELAAQAGECSLFRAVHDVVHSFALPTEQPQAVAPPLGSDGGAPGGQMMMQQRQYQQQRPMGGMMPSMMGAGQPGPRDRMQ
ncbi:mediator of RNA polymerase II transcription subunit 14-like [Amphibalanus amphitrite]|uniref:mediator of RNA polymerase II transcription subunit 14-like n=1 Tax=Amphibalanus amphitrite TaxID=1232801 RepID=UPI001C8FADBA|nr:mediator of RNA polymerase II transcription subunit 14-like [Amphibalanus amphitrite]